MVGCVEDEARAGPGLWSRSCGNHGLPHAEAALLPQLANARLLADLLAQVVELRAVDVADRSHVDLLDLRRVQRERPLDADAEGVLAHRERLAHAGTLALDHDALEHLRAPTLALDHLEVDAHRVPGLELGDPVAQLLALECLDDLAHKKGGRRAGRIVAKTGPSPASRGPAASGSRFA